MAITKPTIDLPLCVNQEYRLLFSEMLRKRFLAETPNVVASGLLFRGSLSPELLQKSLRHIVSNHAGLRTTIEAKQNANSHVWFEALELIARAPIVTHGLFSQSVREVNEVPLPIIDLSNLDKPTKDLEVESILHRESAQPFNYGIAPLIRFSLVRLGISEHLLLIVVDPLVADLWSMRLFRREVIGCYTDLSRYGRTNIVPPKSHFTDYALWQSQQRKNNYFDPAIRYWSKVWQKFGGARISYRHLAASLAPRNPIDLKGAVQTLDLGCDVGVRIKNFAKQLRVTLHMMMFAIVCAALSQYTGKRHIALWGYYSNRGLRETQESIGHFSTGHLLGLDLSCDPSWRELIQQARGVVVAGSRFQDLPLELLWAELRCYPRYNDEPAVLFLSETDELGSWEGIINEALMVRPADLPDFTAGTSFTIIVKEQNDSLMFKVKYQRQRFDERGLSRLLVSLGNATKHCLTNPEDPTSSFAAEVTKADYHDRRMDEFVLLDSSLVPPGPVKVNHS